MGVPKSGLGGGGLGRSQQLTVYLGDEALVIGIFGKRQVLAKYGARFQYFWFFLTFVAGDASWCKLTP